MTTISVSDETWRWLMAQKQPGDSFDDVLRRLRERVERQSETPTVDVETIAADEGLSDEETAAVEAIVESLASAYPGWSKKQEIVDTIHGEYPAGKQPDWWWRTLVTRILLERDVIEKFGDDQGLIRLQSTDG